MKIPLNIDWQQILLHLFNFAILAGGLYFLLYKPVKAFMDKRMAQYQQQEEEAAAKLAEANAMEKKYREHLEAAEEEIAQKKSQAAKEAEKIAQTRLEEAKKKEEQILAEAREAAEQEKRKAVQEAREEIVELAVQMAGKVLKGEEVSHGQS